MRNAWVLFLACAAAAQDFTKLAEEAKLTLEEAIEQGLKESGEGVCFHAELERDKGIAAWSIDVAQGKKTCNVLLDAKTGKVLDKEVEDEDHSIAVALAKVMLKDAVAEALRAAPGKAVEARILTVNNRKASISVKIAAGEGVTGVTVNAVTGEAKVGWERQPDDRPFTDTFAADDLSPTGRNPFLILEPGFVLVLEGGNEKLTITVLDETKEVDGVATRVVEEREEKEGKLVEVSRNFFAISKRTNDVFYFGEEVDIYKDGAVVSHDGAWLSGKDGARFGLMMPGTPLVGARYYQEIAPGVAMDRAEIVGVNETFETPTAKFEGCVKAEESTPLEGGKEHKYYARGIGLLRDGRMRLVKHGKP